MYYNHHKSTILSLMSSSKWKTKETRMGLHKRNRNLHHHPIIHYNILFRTILHINLNVRNVKQHYGIHAKQKKSLIFLTWFLPFMCVTDFWCLLTKLEEVQTSVRRLFWQMENDDIFCRKCSKSSLVPHSHFSYSILTLKIQLISLLVNIIVTIIN